MAAKKEIAPLPFFNLNDGKWFTQEELIENKIFDSFYFRASSVGKLMASPEKNEIPTGAMTELEKMAGRIIYNTKPQLSNFAIQKGLTMEDVSIDLYCEVDNTFATKNKVRMYYWHPEHGVLLTGECDLDDYCKIRNLKITIDVKTAYSTETMPVFLKCGDRKGYEWQLCSYNVLYGTDLSKLAYCLPSTPDHLIKKGEPESWHLVDHIDPKFRVSIIELNRDSQMINQLMNRLAICKQKLSELVLSRGYVVKNECEYLEQEEE